MEFSVQPFNHKIIKLIVFQNVILILFVIGIASISTQIVFADDDKIDFITVDQQKFKQPESKYKYQEITIIGHIVDYVRGDKVSIVIIYPDKSQETINTFASKKGDIYTLMHITHESQIGMHQIILQYNEESKASTFFNILEN